MAPLALEYILTLSPGHDPRMLGETRRSPETIMKAAFLLLLAYAAWAQDTVPVGRKTFEARCSVCHGADGNGGEMGPAIARRVTNLTDSQLRSTILEGLPGRGMPAVDVPATDLPPLLAFLRSLRPRGGFGFQPYPAKVRLTNGNTLEGTIVSEGFDEAALRTAADNRIHLLRKIDGSTFREVISEIGWPTYNGDIGGNRYTKQTQIDKNNVSRVAPRWMFTLPNVSGTSANAASSSMASCMSRPAMSAMRWTQEPGIRSGITSARATRGSQAAARRGRIGALPMPMAESS